MAADPELVIAFTGHRPNKVGGYGHDNPMRDWILRSLLAVLRELKPTKAISGMALGVDQWAARCCNHLGIPWIAAIPFYGQETVWPMRSQVEYRSLIRTAQETKVVCHSVLEPWRAMQLRNEWMVDNCDILIAVWDGTPGGTANCVKYAQLMGKKIVYIDPRKMIIRYSWA